MAGLTEEAFRQLVIASDRCKIYCQGSFEDYLQVADLLISYSSTTIEEALQNRVPVLQYDPQGKYCHIPAQRLHPDRTPKADTCFFVDRRENLEWALGWIVENQLQSGKTPDLDWTRHIYSGEKVVPVHRWFSKLMHSQSGGGLT
jgi:hypothetical protein